MIAKVDKSFVRSVLASAIGAALFIPVHSEPWWLTLLRDIPGAGGVWPLLGGAATWAVYWMGVRTGRVHSDIDGGRPAQKGHLESAHDDARQVSSGKVDHTSLQSLVEVARSLKDASTVEGERRVGEHLGMGVTVHGIVVGITDLANHILVSIQLDTTCDVADSVVLCHLRVGRSLAPAIKALANGTHFRASGVVREIRHHHISLDECDVLRIGDGFA